MAAAEADGVDVFRFSLSVPASSVERLRACLSDDELARADRYALPEVADHFVVGRATLRVILAQRLEVEPRQISFRYGVHGRPELGEPWNSSGVFFNLTHSHGLALLGMTQDVELGIDLERVRSSVATESVARRYFAPAEVEALLALTEADRVGAFFRIWTRKEAYLKAVGSGITGILQSFEVSLTPGRGARLLRHYRDPFEAARWSLYDLADPRAQPEYEASLILESKGAEVIRLWDWDSARSVGGDA